MRAKGQNIKRPQPEGGKRKDSYCARSKGQMKMFPKAAKILTRGCKAQSEVEVLMAEKEFWEKKQPKKKKVRAKKLTPTQIKKAKLSLTCTRLL